jgi:hypothetical protein
MNTRPYGPRVKRRPTTRHPSARGESAPVPVGGSLCLSEAASNGLWAAPATGQSGENMFFSRHSQPTAKRSRGSDQWIVARRYNSATWFAAHEPDGGSSLACSLFVATSSVVRAEIRRVARAVHPRSSRVVARGPFAAELVLRLCQVRDPNPSVPGRKFGCLHPLGVSTRCPRFDNEWYPRNMYKEGERRPSRTNVSTYGPQSKFGYMDFIPMSRPRRFDARRWGPLSSRPPAFAMSCRSPSTRWLPHV